MVKESRISLRITKDTSNKIDRYVAEGRFASRSDFTNLAVDNLMRQMEGYDDDVSILFEIISHLMIHTIMPVHTVPRELDTKFKIKLAERRTW